VRRVRAIEFFSGIGAFAEAARQLPIDVIAAFDQSQAANDVYLANFGLTPRSRNLDSIESHELPEAGLWWMSPPCTPFSRRGQRRDDGDPRAASFLNLIRLIPACLPEIILVENVRGFAGSRVHEHLVSVLEACAYQVEELYLCSTQFGTPMRRPRYFVAACRGGQRRRARMPARTALLPLAEFLDGETDASLLVDDATAARYGAAYDIVDPQHPEAIAICFTSGYYRCQKASGSMITLPGGRLRRFSPEEIVRLLGFSEHFIFPETLPLQVRWRLAGNSVDVRAIRYLLGELLGVG
jgi:site-specific DNA-cytosine methylase